MKIVTETLAYVTPDEGQGVFGLAKEIAEAKRKKEIGDKVFLELPDGNNISIKGNTAEEIRDSIMTQWEGDPKF